MSEPLEDLPPSAAVPFGDPPMIDRESSWLRFNERVLDEAADPTNPLLERVRFISIFHRNLDEFFMIRVSGIRHQLEAGVEVPSHQGQTPRQRLDTLSNQVRATLEHADAVLHDLTGALIASGIMLVRYEDLSRREQTRWERYYDQQVHPTLTPLAISKAFPFPFISNLSLNMAVMVDAPDGERRLARIKIPDHLPRLLSLDDGPRRDGAPLRFMPIESLVKANLSSLFPGMEVERPFTFRVTRDADVEIREDEADDLLKYIETEMRKRRFGDVVRLEIDASAPDEIVSELHEGLEIDEQATYRVPGMVAPSGLSRLADLELPQHRFAAFIPAVPNGFKGESLFRRISKGDVMVHHPFDAFASVAEFVRVAARDPNVLAIKQTLYRTSGDSPVIAALLEAVSLGKQVAAVVELKARFDEENNIVWARRLEEAGVHVIYGVPGLKTHAKLAMVVRREERGLRRYVHIGTGNYNPVTARVYTDLGLFTCDEEICADVADLFNQITGFARPATFRKLLVAPRFMMDDWTALIRHETRQAKLGKPARIVAKVNGLTEPKIITALYDASKAGVKVDLLVRGICSLVPGVPGLSENIRVRSVIGRFLEHARVLWFHHGGDPKVYIGSADLMGRNLHRRVEVMVPIESKRWRKWLWDSYLVRYLEDVGRSREMRADGSWTRVRDELGATQPDVHEQFLADLE